MKDILARGTERRSDMHGDGLAAALARVVEYRQREHFSVKMNGHVALHLQWKVVQHLSIRGYDIFISCFHGSTNNAIVEFYAISNKLYAVVYTNHNNHTIKTCDMFNQL